MGFFDIFKKKNGDTSIQKEEGLLKRLKDGLSKTSIKLSGGLENLIFGRKKIDDELLEELEELFLTADIGVNTTNKIIEEVRTEVSRDILKNPEELKNSIKQKLLKILSIDNNLRTSDSKPFVILVVGVNGAGKTTSIAKLANMFKNQGFSVLLAAGDTFRAAAIEQIQIWGDRVGIPVIKQSEGSDSAAVIYDAVESAKAKGIDIVIADTAGRLHNKFNLMNELKKVVKVIGKSISGAPNEVLLVIDATAGQNSLAQAKKFKEEIGVTGIILTKLDGTSKGGSIIGIVDELNIPVKFIGFGEKMDDLKPFDATMFVNAMFDK